ncbi:VWA N-terminal [Trinorchestia longiramus]|nr:VWA N-terminal [Trinorchestia longiramus]
MGETLADFAIGSLAPNKFGVDDLDSMSGNNCNINWRCSAENLVHFRREEMIVERDFLDDGTLSVRIDSELPQDGHAPAEEKEDCETVASKCQRWRPECLARSVDNISVTLNKMLFSYANLFSSFITQDTLRQRFSSPTASPYVEDFKSKQKLRLGNLSRHKLKENKSTCLSEREANFWTGFWKIIFVFMIILELCSGTYSSETPDDMPHQEIKSWATTTGNHLSTLVDTVTKFSTIEQRFNANKPSVTRVDGAKLVKEMSQDMSNMMGHKLQAVKRIMNVAEESYKDWASKQEDDRGNNAQLKYIHAKKISKDYDECVKRKDIPVDGESCVKLSTSKHFDGLYINTSMSSIHVPTNVYDRSPKVLNAIRWSETLDRTFSSNYDVDPTLHWQYFGSAVGFLRQYPASSWEMDQDEPDLYDARLRSWYIQAANNPKDMIILLDVSGSMTGLRQEIAKHVVLNILDTLNENDFVNIFTFSETTRELVGCFNDTLVQANLENIGEFKMALAEIKTEQIANISQALTRAFTLLASHNERGLGAQCNQAIMLITDGAPYKHYKIFEEFNWPQRQVRLFTYLIGREITDIGNLLWMACANKGYFVHVSTLAEVREQVLQYIPVIARPLVMYREKHPEIWTGVYADVARPYNPLKILTIAARPDKVFLDPKQTEWLWELRERKRQLERTKKYKELKRIALDFDKYKNSASEVVNSTVLDEPEKVEKFLRYGLFAATDTDIARIKAEAIRSTRLFLIMKSVLTVALLHVPLPPPKSQAAPNPLLLFARLTWRVGQSALELGALLERENHVFISSVD